ncbi:MAG: septum formation protein Maf, partial [Proteobacteria bacterium]|nr:septum formation protein Maf [Pseudomonadota bacterium]
MTHPNQTDPRRQEPIILASKSPRRKELLEQAGLIIEILASEIDETALPLSGPKEYVQKLSRLKAGHIGKLRPDTWIIGADTIVVVDDVILGKPKSRAESIQMLRTLNNRAHSVFTGYTIYCHARNLSITNAIETNVIIKHLSRDEINWYAGTNEPYDKAGGYGIQGIGAFLVRKI